MKTAEIKLTINLDDKLMCLKPFYGSPPMLKQKKHCQLNPLCWRCGIIITRTPYVLIFGLKICPVDDMKRFFYETLQTMGDSFLRATGETNIVEDLRDYCAHFADKMEISQK